MSNIFKFLCLVSLLCLLGCTQAETEKPDSLVDTLETQKTPEDKKTAKIENSARVIHVLVALCDNENQGIVPVSKSLGDGENPKTNLYWGAAYGLKTYFSKSEDWEKIAEVENPKTHVLQRIIFKYKSNDIYLIADAYRGSRIKETINDFFAAVSGEQLENVKINDKTVQTLGSADLVTFVGHNGLMDFKLEKPIVKQDEDEREAIILACLSKKYFARHLKQTSAEPLLWTSNLMAPESYILHDALEGWVKNETDEEIRTRAAKAYSKYQKISLKSSKGLLITGW